MARILLVEDEFVIALNASLILEDQGYSVEIASNGADGLDVVRSTAPDLIITDFMMPGMDGLEFIEALRSQGLATPIVIATSILEDRLPKRMGCRYDAYLRKPYLAEELLSVVQALLK